MWEDFLPNGATEVITGVIVFLLGLSLRTLVSTIRNYVTAKPFRQTWNRVAGEGKRLYIVFAVVPTQDEFGRMTSVLTLPVATAMWDMVVALERAYPTLKLELYSADTFPYSKIGENIVVIGGPYHNELSERLSERMPLLARFGSEYKLLDTQSGEVFQPTRGKNKGVTRDYGTVAIFANPYNAESTVYVLAGCKAHGTNAAIRSMIKPCVGNYYSATGAKLGSQVIIETHVINDFISMPEIIRVLHSNRRTLSGNHSIENFRSAGETEDLIG